MVFKIIPYIGVGEIEFGMSRNRVREFFNNVYIEFIKSTSSENTTDDFLDLHVYYNKVNECEAVEIFEVSSVAYGDIDNFGISYTRVKKVFERLDNTLDINEVGFTSYKFGIGVYAPYAEDEPNEPVESVIVFSKSYYE